jgi:hypothetical protein
MSLAAMRSSVKENITQKGAIEKKIYAKSQTATLRLLINIRGNFKIH